MRVWQPADVHGQLAVYEWLVTSARRHDVQAILLAGDLLGCLDGFATPEDAQRHEAKTLSDVLGAAGVPVLYIMGNDDLVELDSRAPEVQSIHGRRVACGRFSFVRVPVFAAVHGRRLREARVGHCGHFLRIVTGLVDSTAVDFMSHRPALDILDPGFGETHIGSASLRAFLERHGFLAHAHGHSHAGFGRCGKHFNVASAGQARAMIVDLETMQHERLGGRKERARSLAALHPAAV